MKKILSLVLVMALAVSMAACGSKPAAPAAPAAPVAPVAPPQTAEPALPTGTAPEIPEDAEIGEAFVIEDVTVRVAAMKGPTGISLVNLMEASETGDAANKYEFMVAGAADEITPKFVQGELDIAAIPVNLASVLYNKTEGQVQVLAINNHGVLFILSKGCEIGSVADLAGKTIIATGKGSVPEYNLRYILSQNGIDPDKDVTIEFKSEAAEVVAAAKEADEAIVMLPQPYVIQALGAVEGLSIALDLTAEWGKVCDSEMVTAVIAVRKAFAEENPGAVKAFINEYKASSDKTNADAAGTAALCEKFDIAKAQVAEKAIPKCSIEFAAGEDMIPAISNYLQVIFDQAPGAVGGKLPADDFYYVQ